MAENEKDMNPYNKTTEHNSYTIYEIIKIYSQQQFKEPKISSARLKK